MPLHEHYSDTLCAARQWMALPLVMWVQCLRKTNFFHSKSTQRIEHDESKRKGKRAQNMCLKRRRKSWTVVIPVKMQFLFDDDDTSANCTCSTFEKIPPADETMRGGDREAQTQRERKRDGEREESVIQKTTIASRSFKWNWTVQTFPLPLIY